MFLKHKLFQDTAILTFAGIISRILGFFFRIFLSHAFGEENVGLYQLIFPLYALCLSVSTAGLQTAVSRITAEKHALGKNSEAETILKTALCITVLISAAEIFIVQKYAPFIAKSFLGDERCTDLILIMSYALPFAAIHSCICGRSLGLQNAKMPAISQLIEQCVRITTVFLAYTIIRTYGNVPPSIVLAGAGIVTGEFAAAAFSVHCLAGRGTFFFFKHSTLPDSAMQSLHSLRELLSFSLPLTANRTALTLLQSIEAASIPTCLKLYGLSSAEAVSLYGVMTGMALPCILFPSAVTGSIGTLLLPAVSAASTSGNRRSVTLLLRKAIFSCLALGLACCLIFLVFGKWIGQALFHSSDAGRFILTLAWLCPFLYTNTALLSAINGYGKTSAAFFINMTGLLIRIAGVFLAIPRFGIQGYLWALLLGQLAVSVLALIVLTALTGQRT